MICTRHGAAYLDLRSDVDDAFDADLGGDLIGAAEDVRIVELHRPHPAQPAKYTRSFGAELRAELGQAQRELAVAVPARAVDHCVVRTQARPQQHLLRSDAHRREHVLAIVGPVSRDLIQLPLAQCRRVDVLVARPALHLPDVLLDRMPDRRPRGQPVRQASADQRDQSRTTPAHGRVCGDHSWSLSLGSRVNGPTTQQSPEALTPGLSVHCALSGRRDDLRRRRHDSKQHGTRIDRASPRYIDGSSTTQRLGSG